MWVFLPVDDFAFLFLLLCWFDDTNVHVKTINGRKQHLGQLQCYGGYHIIVIIVNIINIIVDVVVIVIDTEDKSQILVDVSGSFLSSVKGIYEKEQ